jgi:hypothetical protein
MVQKCQLTFSNILIYYRNMGPELPRYEDVEVGVSHLLQNNNFKNTQNSSGLVKTKSNLGSTIRYTKIHKFVKFVNLVTPRAGARHELLINTLA